MLKSDIKWEAKLIRHHNLNRIAVYFEKDTALIARFKQITGAKWSKSLAAWHLPASKENRKRFKIGENTSKTFSVEVALQTATFRNYLLSKRYSANTIKAYSEALQSFLMFFSSKPACELTNADVIRYNTDFYSPESIIRILSKPNC